MTESESDRRACAWWSPTSTATPGGCFIETYRREWFPQGREMVQANRADRQAGCGGGPALPPPPGRLLVRPLRARPAWSSTTSREGGPTDGATLALDLGAADDGAHNHRGVFIPPGVAHGFAALTDMTITYLVDGYYNPADELGVAWDDPAIGADWGVTDPVLSDAGPANPRRADLDPPVAAHAGLRT